MTNDQLARVVDALQWEVHLLQERVTRMEKGLPVPEPPKYIAPLPTVPAFVPCQQQPASPTTEPAEIPELNLSGLTLVGEKKS